MGKPIAQELPTLGELRNTLVKIADGVELAVVTIPCQTNGHLPDVSVTIIEQPKRLLEFL